MTGSSARPAAAILAGLSLACAAPACNGILGHQPGTPLADDAGEAGGADAHVDAYADAGASDAIEADTASFDSGGGEAAPPDAPDADADGGCGDLTKDPDNCGTCGHNCGTAGSCVSGQCVSTAAAGSMA